MHLKVMRITQKNPELPETGFNTKRKMISIYEDSFKVSQESKSVQVPKRVRIPKRLANLKSIQDKKTLIGNTRERSVSKERQKPRRNEPTKTSLESTPLVYSKVSLLAERPDEKKHLLGDKRQGKAPEFGGNPTSQISGFQVNPSSSTFQTERTTGRSLYQLHSRRVSKPQFAMHYDSVGNQSQGPESSMSDSSGKWTHQFQFKNKSPENSPLLIQKSK